MFESSIPPEVFQGHLKREGLVDGLNGKLPLRVWRCTRLSTVAGHAEVVGICFAQGM
jgi:hypothetical protein